jgi:molybdopterin/thiamine biosynthesis adenylyltransferase
MLQSAFNSHANAISPIFDRNVKAFGPSIQQTLTDLRIGIVGCGGTGSSVAEQLVRLGIRNLTLIDADDLSASNVTRVYGSTLENVGTAKVHVLEKHLRSIAPDLNCVSLRKMVTEENAARSLLACDTVFGCTDDNAGRLVLSRFSSYMLTPVIDCGVLITGDSTGYLNGINGRVTTLSYGSACLVCRNRVDLARAASELLTPTERQQREDEGYAPALPGIEPAVVTFTTSVACAAVNELLERLIGFGPTPRPTEVILRFHDREISTNIANPKSGHYCHPARGKLGLGTTAPFLEQAWSR